MKSRDEVGRSRVRWVGLAGGADAGVVVGRRGEQGTFVPECCKGELAMRHHSPGKLRPPVLGIIGQTGETGAKVKIVNSTKRQMPRRGLITISVTPRVQHVSSSRGYLQTSTSS